jgi:hypothetical protein
MTEKQIHNQLVKALHAVAELIPDTSITIIISGKNEKGFYRQRASNTDRAKSFEDIKALLKADQTQADFGTLNNN